jgi:hypothetical protein
VFVGGHCFGIAVAAVAALKGGILTTFNDIFAASGYLAVLLAHVYKQISVHLINTKI